MYTVDMAPRPQRYKRHLSFRLGDEHVAVLDALRARLEAEQGRRLQYGDVERWLLEQPAVRRLAKLDGKR